MSVLANIGYFLFSLLFGSLIFLLWLRVGFQYFCINKFHPLHQTIHNLTNPLVRPFTSLYKSINLKSTKYDWAGLSLLVTLELCKFILINLFFLNTAMPWSYIILVVIANLIYEPCQLLFYAILVRVLISWINPHWQNPIAEIIIAITEPILYKCRRILPIISGIDLSPLLAIIGLKVITICLGSLIQ